MNDRIWALRMKIAEMEPKNQKCNLACQWNECWNGTKERLQP